MEAIVAAVPDWCSWTYVGYAIASYIAIMLVFRCSERRRRHPAPGLKGWAAHETDAKAAYTQFTNFLSKRKDKQYVSINRSRGGHDDSNRTIAATYKQESLRVDVSRLDGVIAIDAAARLMHIEPGLPMDEMARVAIAYGFVPEVVLEFPGITAGGALCGGGIESSSHKYGCFFDTVEEVDIITGDGQHRKGVSRTNEPDLFHALSVTYGTMGILTRIAVRVEPARKFVHVRYIHCSSLDIATATMERLANCGESAPTFIDGVALSPTSAMAVIGEPVDAPPVSVPRRSLREYRWDAWFFWLLTDLARKHAPITSTPPAAADKLYAAAQHEEYMPLDDYLFRFDRGAFWMARPGLHLFYGRFAYSDSGATSGPAFLLRLKYAWLCTTRELYRMLHKIGDELLARTYVVQDYIMPSRVEACALAEYTASPVLGIWPLWVCPVRMVLPRQPTNIGLGFPVQKTQHNGLMFNIGVYGAPGGGKPFDPVVVNKGLEDKASELQGRKMLYAQSFYTNDEFWALFNKPAYEKVRAKYSCDTVFPAVDTKLLLGKRLDSMRGVKAVSFAEVWRPMAAWYFSLWQEVLTPRALHSWLGLQHTDVFEYEKGSLASPAAAGGAAAEAPAKTAKPATAKARRNSVKA